MLTLLSVFFRDFKPNSSSRASKCTMLSCMVHEMYAACFTDRYHWHQQKLKCYLREKKYSVQCKKDKKVYCLLLWWAKLLHYWVCEHGYYLVSLWINLAFFLVILFVGPGIHSQSLLPTKKKKTFKYCSWKTKFRVYTTVIKQWVNKQNVFLHTYPNITTSMTHMIKPYWKIK